MAKEIPLTKGKVALVDDADYQRVAIYKWHAIYKGGHVYAEHSLPRRNGKHKNLSLHRFIVHAPDGCTVDHIDGDGLNCQRANLRICTHAENIRHRVSLNANNTSGITGVSWDARRSKWSVYITTDGRRQFVGYFSSLDKAADARRQAGLSSHGEYASAK